VVGPSTSDAGPSGAFGDGVDVHLTRNFDVPQTISFGLPVPPHAVSDAGTVRVSAGGKPIAATIKPILREHDAMGAATGVRSLLIQLPASVLTGTEIDVHVAWKGTGDAPASNTVPYATAGLSIDSPATADTAVRSIMQNGGMNQLVETMKTKRTLFPAREPMVLATYPSGYLADTGILGPLVGQPKIQDPNLAGVAYLGTDFSDFAASAMYAEKFAVNPDAILDPLTNFEGWLYDRCATYLSAYVHTDDVRFLRHAYRSCSWYISKINLNAPNAGFFSGKTDPDSKYSHLRGVYAYYALTGDEAALAAGTAIAEMWLADTAFVGPYRMGHLRGSDKLWTERLLGTSMEGLYFGHRLTGDVKFLSAYKEMFETAYKHVTGDAAALAIINPGVNFPPQNCFIHTALQHAEGNADQPWCSGWMMELVIDPLLEYQEQTGDNRADEIIVRLARFIRDTGSAYFDSNPLDDTFLKPSICDDPTKGENRRRLYPLYGAGRLVDGTRVNSGNYDDDEHCADTMALTAAAIRALKRQGKYDKGGPIGPFASEGESFLQLHHEFASCAERVLQGWVRTSRDPSTWTSASLSGGLSNPTQFIADNKIGFPVHAVSPERKLSWWFNHSMLQYGLLLDAGVAIPKLTPGKVQPTGCK
jgi:hypothetical protein